MAYLDEFNQILDRGRKRNEKPLLNVVEGVLTQVLCDVVAEMNQTLKILPTGSGIVVWDTTLILWNDRMLQGTGETPREAAEHLLRQVDGSETPKPVKRVTRFEVILENAG